MAKQRSKQSQMTRDHCRWYNNRFTFHPSNPYDGALLRKGTSGPLMANITRSHAARRLIMNSVRIMRPKPIAEAARQIVGDGIIRMRKS